MLSEGYKLRRDLDEAGFYIPATHPKILSPGKRPGYRVGLSPDGSPETMEELDATEIASCWNHIEGKQNAFPVVKIQHALLASSNDAELRDRALKLKKGQDSARVSLLREALDHWARSLPFGDEQTWLRLQKKAERWCEIFRETPDRFSALPLMLQRFTCSNLSVRPWLQQLAARVVEGLEQGHLTNSKLAETLLIGKLTSKDKPAEARIPLVLGIAEGDVSVRIGDPRMRTYVSRRLAQAEREGVERPKLRCGMTGEDRVLLRGAFPEVQLPRLGNTKLFSKYDATPCEFRYIKSPQEWKDRRKSFAIGEDIAADIADGFRALTTADLHGKTWRMVANGKWEGSGKSKKEKKDLLLVYCEGQPVISDEAAGTFGTDEREQRDQFENDAEGLCRALEGIIKHRPKSHLHLLIIGKADKEKKQVLLHVTPTPQQVLNAAQKWGDAVRENTPHVRLRLPEEFRNKKKLDACEGHPLPPYPDQVVRLLSHHWVRDGSSPKGPRGKAQKPYHEVFGPGLGEVLNLMLRIEGKWEPAARRMLSLLIQHLSPLLIGLFGAKHAYGPRQALNKREPLFEYPRSSRESALRGVAVSAILLDALDYRKEQYMSKPPFQVGQVLALADTLHKDYCMVVRKGQLPTSLIGTGLMRRALDNPSAAIADLGERMMEYVRWAKTVAIPGGDDKEQERIAVHEARKKLRQYQKLAASLGAVDLPTQVTDVEKAQLLLGFLASPPDEDENQNDKDGAK